jgi:hypothetical protein
VAGVVTWTAATGGVGRSAAIVGGIACLRLMAAEPIARVGLRRPTVLGSLSPRRKVLVAAVGLRSGARVRRPRLAGVRSSAAVATVIAFGGLAAGIAILVRGQERETMRQRGLRRSTRRMGRSLP